MTRTCAAGLRAADMFSSRERVDEVTATSRMR
jgi:hypothetical protein